MAHLPSARARACRLSQPPIHRPRPKPTAQIARPHAAAQCGLPRFPTLSTGGGDKKGHAAAPRNPRPSPPLPIRCASEKPEPPRLWEEQAIGLASDSASEGTLLVGDG
ncbi:hypothetical protein GUJ93_ZPchr0006g43102 [Zizania palustris]|uniref:Uncharacterized protein n=1 Tax=Zizania palustris TaxID=103762 RepID=A0A8J5T1K6_ZIZPA|nr:hypothetical protein GUJ93_ZPchr0006g43102 [Zizania palustris]